MLIHQAAHHRTKPHRMSAAHKVFMQMPAFNIRQTAIRVEPRHGLAHRPTLHGLYKQLTFFIERGITRQAIFKICSKRALEARIPDFSPHDFRRTFVGDMLDAGADIVTVKDLAGHASIQTTARYDRRGQERLQNA
ncbi:MAG: site-specific integrase, partial [Anaerolineae bacterium]|nr:site-specific integrase [Anaerolineae bacterium]